MKVLFQSRANRASSPGGDVIQMEQTATHLRKMGLQVDVDTTGSISPGPYDIVHLFNLSRPQEIYGHARRAKALGKVVALSTIYMDYSEYEKHARGGVAGVAFKCMSKWQIEKVKIAARVLSSGKVDAGSARVLVRGFKAMCRRTLEVADVLLPNSHSEFQRLCADFPEAVGKRVVVVPNAIDTRLFDYDTVRPSSTVARWNGCVLCVARVEGRKCQLDVVRAAKKLPYVFLFIGQAAVNQTKYYDEVRRHAGERVHFLGQVPHEQLPEYYRAAKVHVLASWMETTGLSSLEAGAMGCNLVITDRGDTREYFADQAEYCVPGSVDSVVAAIKTAYERPSDSRLRERIAGAYTWQIAAEQTLKAYCAALEVRH